MTKYFDKKFSVSMPGAKYADSWDRIFGKKCPVCGEPEGLHWDGVTPGSVFIDGFGVIPCAEAAEITQYKKENE